MLVYLGFDIFDAYGYISTYRSRSSPTRRPRVQEVLHGASLEVVLLAGVARARVAALVVVALLITANQPRTVHVVEGPRAGAVQAGTRTRRRRQQVTTRQVEGRRRRRGRRQRVPVQRRQQVVVAPLVARRQGRVALAPLVRVVVVERRPRSAQHVD